MVDISRDVLMENEQTKTGLGGYITLVLGVIFFSGLLGGGEHSPLSAFDFSSIVGKFGTMKDSKLTFVGAGGFGVKEGFLFTLTLIPTAMFAMAVVELIQHYGGLRAAQRLFSPLLRPLLGIPGACGIAIIAGFQSTDAGAGLNRLLREEGYSTEKEKTILAAFQFSAGGTLVNFMGTGSALFGFLSVKFIIPMAVMFALKIFGANMMRLYLNRTMKDEGDDNAK